MNFKITLKPDEEYYKEAYGEIVSTLKVKKYEPYLAVIMIVWGVIFYFQDINKKLGMFPILFTCVGFYELFKLYYEKKKWLKDRMDKGVVEKQIELEFNDEIIKHNGPFSKGEINWNGLIEIVQTKKGLLLKPDKGISIYLPNSLFTDEEQINFIMSKKKINSI